MTKRDPVVTWARYGDHINIYLDGALVERLTGPRLGRLVADAAEALREGMGNG